MTEYRDGHAKGERAAEPIVYGCGVIAGFLRTVGTGKTLAFAGYK